jgi:hypothetical protein
MHNRSIAVILVLLVGLTFFATSCGKDKKATSPEELLPSVSVTLGSDEVTFGAVGAAYSSSLGYLIMAFAQGPQGGYPTCALTVGSMDTVQVGMQVECDVSVYMDTSTIYECGSLAEGDSAISTVSFSSINLTRGGLISGDVNGMMEHRHHMEEGLTPVMIQFRNIPLETTN